jgi:hypothetical protein
MRNYLVFIRAGKGSLHRELLEADPQRNWDCCVNAWAGAGAADALDAARGRIAIFSDDSINKFEAFAACAAQDDRVQHYRQVLLLDDDLRFNPGDLSRYFALCETEDLFLSQPAIAWGSHANHLLNLWNPVTEVRRVNFVEVMAPCFSRAALAELMAPTFGLTRCTWGIDYAWSSLLQGRPCLSIVDAVPMAHTKPMDRAGGPFYDKLRAQGIEPEDELAQVHARYPRWGDMGTLASGHRYQAPVADEVNERLVHWMEARKLQAHLQAGGSLAPQLAVGERYDRAGAGRTS